jgi:hypothetical protein
MYTVAVHEAAPSHFSPDTRAKELATREMTGRASTGSDSYSNLRGVAVCAAQLSAGRPAVLQRDEGEESGAANTEASEA